MSNAIRHDYVSRADYRQQVEGRPGRFERIDGQIVAMAPERSSHNRCKQAVWLALRNAVNAAGLPCEPFGDGMTVEIGEDHDYEPDAILRCGPPLDGDPVAIPDPLVVVEVLSPSTARTDLFRKLVDYFRLPSVQHYLIFASDRPEVIHYRRAEVGTTQRVYTSGPILLDPPGLTITVEDIYRSGG